MKEWIIDENSIDHNDLLSARCANKAYPLVRCKDCGNRECDGRAGTIVCGITGESHSRLWFCADGVAKDINVPNT